MAKIKLGLIVPLQKKPNEELKKVYMLGFPTCQVLCWNANLYTSDIAHLLKRAANNYGIEITAIWAGLPGKHVWNLIDGPNTIGLVPPETREIRLKALKKPPTLQKKLM